MGSAVPAQRNEPPPADTPMPPYILTKQLSDDYSGLPLTRERTTSANPDAPAMATVRSRQDAEAIWFDRACWSVLADGASTGGSYSVFELEMVRGLAGRPHIHDHADEAVYLLEGALELLADDVVHTLRPGSSTFVPRGCVHAVPFR